MSIHYRLVVHIRPAIANSWSAVEVARRWVKLYPNGKSETDQLTYCMAGHTNLSRMAKVDEDHILALREGRPLANAQLQALRAFAASVTRNRGAVEDADVQAFKAAGYDNLAVLDVLVLAATKLISNYTNHLANTPLDGFMKGAEWTAPGRSAHAV